MPKRSLQLRTISYVDIVELNDFVSEVYGEPILGSSNSFHRQVCNALGGEVSQDYMGTIELYEGAEEDYDYDDFAHVASVFRRLMDDGYLPRADSVDVKVWW